MFSAGEIKKVCSEGSALSYDDALKCKDEHEKATNKPFHVHSQTVGMLAGVVAYTVLEGYKPECQSKERKFDSPLGNNEASAKECAASLSRLVKGKSFKAVEIEKRGIKSSIWQVRENKPLP